MLAMKYTEWRTSYITMHHSLKGIGLEGMFESGFLIWAKEAIFSVDIVSGPRKLFFDYIKGMSTSYYEGKWIVARLNILVCSKRCHLWGTRQSAHHRGPILIWPWFHTSVTPLTSVELLLFLLAGLYKNQPLYLQVIRWKYLFLSHPEEKCFWRRAVHTIIYLMALEFLRGILK